MWAIQIDRFAADVATLAAKRVPIPVPTATDVLVRVHGSCLNPSDVKNIMGKLPGTTLPRIPGRDFAGVIVDAPPTHRHLVNSEVFGTVGTFGIKRDGAHAEFLLLPIEAVTPKPKTLSFLEASAVGVNFVTAFEGLVRRARVSPADTVLVTGASGGVGNAVIQLAKWKGARVIAVDRGSQGHGSGAAPEEKHDSKPASPAADGSQVADQAPGRKPGQPDMRIDLSSLAAGVNGLPDAVRALTGGKGVNVVFDTVGGPLFEPALRSLTLDGRQVNITSVGDRRVTFDLLDFYHSRLTLMGVDSLGLDLADCAQILREITPGFEQGVLYPERIVQTFPFSQAGEAYRVVNEAKVKGKIGLVPEQPPAAAL